MKHEDSRGYFQALFLGCSFSHCGTILGDINIRIFVFVTFEPLSSSVWLLIAW